MWYIAIVVGLVLLGGLFSGLTLGLMGLDSVSPLIIGKKTTRSRPFPVLTFSRAQPTTILTGEGLAGLAAIARMAFLRSAPLVATRMNDVVLALRPSSESGFDGHGKDAAAGAARRPTPR